MILESSTLIGFLNRSQNITCIKLFRRDVKIQKDNEEKVKERGMQFYN